LVFQQEVIEKKRHCNHQVANVRIWNYLSGACSFGALAVASYLATQFVTETIASSLSAAPKARLEQAALTRFVQASPDEFSVSDVIGQGGQSIALNIKSSSSQPPEDLFAISGLPPEVRLSAGAAYDDFWLVRRKELASLSLSAPEAFARKFQIAITRVRSADRAPVTQTATVSIVGRSPPPDLSARPATRGRAFYSRSQNENILFDKALERFKKGDVAGARAIFEVLATKGDPDAAIAMGETYDPVVLAQLFVKGLQPDEAKAIAWYKKAEELGDQRAKTRLNALNQN
jgi:hypothetical protein